MKKLLAGLAVLPVVSSVALAMGARPAAAATTISSYSVTSVTSTVIRTHATGSSDKNGTFTDSLAEAAYNYDTHQYYPSRVIESATSPSGRTWPDDAIFDLTPMPGEIYFTRVCFTPDGSTTAKCSSWLKTTTSTVSHSVQTNAASLDYNRVIFNPTVTGPLTTCNQFSSAPGQSCNPRMRGQLIVQYGSDTSYGKNLYSTDVETARTGSATREMKVWLEPHTTYHYRACYIPKMRGSVGVYMPSADLMRCGQDRTVTTGDALPAEYGPN